LAMQLIIIIIIVVVVVVIIIIIIIIIIHWSSSIFKAYRRRLSFDSRRNYHKLHTTCCGFLQLFSLLWSKFNTNSLLLYWQHTKHDKTVTYLITKPIIKTKRNIWYTCHRMLA
jgi:flagellar basal body-associated protein FliL